MGQVIHFSEKILQGGIVEHAVSQKLLELGVLVLERLQLPGFADVHATILGLPLVKAGGAHAVLAAQIGHRNARLVLLQYRDDLLFAEPAALHLWSLSWGQSLLQTGLSAGGNVNLSRDFQKSRNAVAFTGYDGMFEVQFFVEVDALATSETNSNTSGTPESRRLIAFDALRSSILEVAREAYANSRRTFYTLTAADFR